MNYHKLSTQTLSDITIWMKYARYLPHLHRRETWAEIVDRNKDMHLKKFPSLTGEIEEKYKLVYDKKVLPSMRSLQFAGKAVEVNNARLFNCGAIAINSPEAFSELMFLLLTGVGIGISVQKAHVEQLPEVRKPIKRTKKYLIMDSIIGWADAIKVLMKSYFYGTARIRYDFSDIRPKGSSLITSGGKAPGPQPLADCIYEVTKILDSKEQGTKLTPFECHLICCHIADAVLAGGIRRAALISMFSLTDTEMFQCKYDNWFEQYPCLGRANNSAIILRHKITKKKFFELWDKIKASRTGEPGIILSNGNDWCFNPCCESSLHITQNGGGFCNLTTFNFSDIQDQAELNKRAEAAAFIGTLQAAYTDFYYLRNEWKKNVEKEALLGVSMTGLASGNLDLVDLTEAAEIVKETNKRVSKLIGINEAHRMCLLKPEGSSSCCLGSSSGIHAWYSKYYIRRIRIYKSEPLYKYLKNKIPELIKDEYFKPDVQAVIEIPVEAPDGAAYSNEPAIDLLERIKKVYTEWIKPGHVKGDNTHNVSATVLVGSDEEWNQVGKWMWENKKYYNGIAVLPRDLGTYVQAPFEEITKEKFEELSQYLKEIDLSEVIEEDDNTALQEQSACSGGSSCEIK